MKKPVFCFRACRSQTRLLTQVVKVVRYIRVMMPTVRDKPGLRESISLLKAFIGEGIELLTAEVIDDHSASSRAGLTISPISSSASHDSNGPLRLQTR